MQSRVVPLDGVVEDGLPSAILGPLDFVLWSSQIFLLNIPTPNRRVFYLGGRERGEQGLSRGRAVGSREDDGWV